MERRISFLAVVAVGLLIVGCQMPSGLGPARDLLAEEEQGSSGEVWPAGTLSVVMDKERGQAVYINENGVRFDVSASEYAGGPLVRCVEVESFTEVPPSDDPEALPVKAIVAGVRDDGTLGAWEIHPDDTIHLTVGEDGQARCLTGSDPSTFLEGMQTRFGWVYSIVGSATDGKTMIIVGNARNSTGSFGLIPPTNVAVYWKVWRLPYSRFCIVSPPRVIGTLEPQVVPADWPRGFVLSLLRARLKEFFFGKLTTYLEVATSVAFDGDVFLVTGKDPQGNPAIAKIEKDGRIVIEAKQEEPGQKPVLTLSTAPIDQEPAETPVRSFGDDWPFNVSVVNEGPGYFVGSFTLTYTVTNEGTQAVATTDRTVVISEAAVLTEGTSTDDVADYKSQANLSGILTSLFDGDLKPGLNHVSVTLSGTDLETKNVTADLAIRYPRVLVETYPPMGTDTLTNYGLGFLYLELYGASSSGPLETNDGGDPLNPVNTEYWNRIDMGDVEPGSYYARIMATNPVNSGPYAIRVTTDPASPFVLFDEKGNRTDEEWAQVYDGLVAPLMTNDEGVSHETIDNVMPGKPVELKVGGHLFRYMNDEVGEDGTVISWDVDWVKIVLP
jgi:hypothetical protein